MFVRILMIFAMALVTLGSSPYFSGLSRNSDGSVDIDALLENSRETQDSNPGDSTSSSEQENKSYRWVTTARTKVVNGKLIVKARSNIRKIPRIETQERPFVNREEFETTAYGKEGRWLKIDTSNLDLNPGIALFPVAKLPLRSERFKLQKEKGSDEDFVRYVSGGQQAQILEDQGDACLLRVGMDMGYGDCDKLASTGYNEEFRSFTVEYDIEDSPTHTTAPRRDPQETKEEPGQSEESLRPTVPVESTGGDEDPDAPRFTTVDESITVDTVRQPRTGRSAEIYDAARRAVGESSRSGPDGGNLACAWFVNKILRRTVGYTVNGDGTSSMYTVFQSLERAGHAERIPVENAQPGDIILSPTVWTPRRNTGHVGIMGSGNQIYSNSSARARWEQNFSMSSWRDRYLRRKGLGLYIYRLYK